MTLELAAPLADLRLLFLDLETTGLHLAAGHRVCEVALLREHGGVEEGRFETLVAPGRLLDPRAAAVNGLNDLQLATAPPFAALVAQLEQLASGSVLIGHHLPFDLAFLAAELARLNRAPLAGPQIDTLVLARRLLRRPSYSLAALCLAFELPLPSHRAMDDVLALRGLFRQLCALLAERNITTLGDVLRFERGLLPGMAEPEPPPLIALALAEGRSLRILYHSRGRPEVIARTIRPIYLSWESGELYLRAFCELRQNVRSFALSRIEQLELERPLC